MAYPTVTLTGRYVHVDGTAAAGSVDIAPTTSPIKDAAGNVVLAGGRRVTLNAAGAFTITLPATDATELNPTGFGYTVTPRLHHVSLAPVTFGMPASLVSLDMADVTPADPAADYAPVLEGPSAYDVAVTNGFVGTEAQWLASLVGPTGAKGDPGTPGTPGAPGTTSWTGITDKPTTFPPEAHGHSSNEVTGLAPVAYSGTYADVTAKPAAFPPEAHDASLVTTGTLGTARIPDLDAAKLTTGTLALGRIPNLDAARIPDLDAAKVTTGTFGEARLPAHLARRGDARLSRGAVMFSLDDGRAQNMALVDIHEALGQRIALGIVSDWVGQADRLTSAQVLDLHNRGHELANHSKTHANYASATAATRATESDTCSDFIASITGERPRTFIYPAGAWSATTDRELYTRFRSWAVTVGASTNLPVPYPLRGTAPRFYRLDLDTPANLDRALDLVRMAAVQPVIVSFFTHWTDQPGTMTTAQYQSIAQLAADLKVPAVLPRDVFGGQSRLMDPSFEIVGIPSWVTLNTGAATSSGVASTPETGISGVRALELTAANPDTAGRQQAVVVTSGKWRVSGRLKNVSGNLVTNDLALRLRYRDWSEAAISFETFYLTIGAAGSWTRFEQDYTVPENCNFAYLDLLLTPATGRSGTLHVDHLDIRPTREGGLG